MHRYLMIAAACAASAALSGCAGFTVPGMSGNGTAANSAMQAFLTDPNCAHHDEANLVTGAAGVPASFNARVLRDCPARPAAVTAVTASPAPQ
jgi:hypothetical protein